MQSLPRFLVNRDFARLWSGQAISTVGDFVFDTTLIIWIATDLLPGSRWAPAAVSALTFCMLAAIMIIGPIAGVFVDRLPYRITMLRSETIRGFLVLGLTVITFIPRRDLPVGVWLALLYVVVFVVNAAGQFFSPARTAAIGDIVPGEADRARAFGLGQATNATAAIIGPPIAAPLLVTVGIQWALLVNALSYGVSYLAVRSVRFPGAAAPDAAASAAPESAAAEPSGPTVEVAQAGSAASGVAAPAAPSGWRAEFAAGVRMFVRNRFLVMLLAIAVTAQLGTGAINALNVFFLSDNLHASTNLLGVLEMGFGGGAIIGALISGRLVQAFGARTVVWSCMALGGVLFGVYARQTSFVAGLLMCVAFMIPVTAMNTGIGPILLAATPKGYFGRMMAVFNPVNMAASTVSVIVAGSLASSALRGFHGDVAGLHIGPIDLIFTVSALLIVAAGTFAAFALPRIPNDDAATETAAPDATAGDAAADVEPVPAPAGPVEQARPIELMQ